MVRAIRIGNQHGWLSAPVLTFGINQPTTVNLATYAYNPKGKVLVYAVMAGYSLPSGATLSGSVVTWTGSGISGATPIRFTLTFGGVTQTSPLSVTTILLPDTTAPFIPTGLAATAPSATQINLTCNAAVDQVVVGATTSGIAGYRWYRDGAPLNTTTLPAFNDTGLTAGTQYSHRVSSLDVAGNESAQSSPPVLTTTQSAGGPSPLPEGAGLAAAYLNDSGITAHSSVLFADNFESYTTTGQLTSSGNYSNFFQAGNLALDTAVFFGGTKSLRMRMPLTGVEVSNAIVRPISPTLDALYLRVYMRFQPTFAGVFGAHSGIRIAGNYGGAGVRPDGTDFFLVEVENSRYQGEGEPGYTNAYVYHPEQDDIYGEHWYPDGTVGNGSQSFGPFFVARPKIVAARGVWLCIEVLVQMNTPGTRNGRVAVWQDGAVIADWQNVRFRDVTSVKIDEIQLENGGQSSSQINDKWYDNLVIATSYIGPVGTSAGGGTVLAASALLADVQAAVTAAVDGDTVLIPNGSAGWSGGISTTKQIRIRAQNYTPTANGTMTRNVTITNNAGTTPLFTFTSGNTHNVGIGGIRFNDGTGTGNYVRFNGSGSKVPLIYDCAFQMPKEGGNNPTNAKIAMLCQGGVFWNCYFDGLGDPNQVLMDAIFISQTRAWQTASTMGLLDTNGQVNLYMENCTAKDCDSLLDIDRAGRAVIRNSVFDGTWSLTHGFTSGLYQGGRHVEIYDNVFRCTTFSRNLGRYFWLRAGTALVTDNDFARATDTQSYNGGHQDALQIGDNTAPSGTDSPMQPGWGHNGTTDVRDPIYVWGNTGAMGSEVSFNNDAGNWSGVTSSLELVVDQGAKPGWTKYPYPHPARTAV